MVMFSINNTDFSNRVVAEGYRVQSEKVEGTWIDGNLKTHWAWLGKKTKIKGSFQMVFLTEQEYVNFQNVLANATTDELITPVNICDNRINQTVQADVHISYTLDRGRKDTGEDYFEIVTITVEEA